MCEYSSYLKQIYPQGARFDALLPKPSYRNCYDLSRYGLACMGEIGEGALSTVYMVKDCDNQIYACKLTSLKHINGGPCAPSFVAEQALQEIHLMLKLRQKGVYGIMPLYAFHPSETVIKGYAYAYRLLPRLLIPESSIIIELLPLAVPFRTFMEELFRSRKRLTVKQACAVFLDILSPLEHMHGKAKIIHRDIKIDNLMLIKLPDGSIRVAISDFNISREFIDTSVSEYTPMGTPGYYNPRIKEKALNQERVTRAEAEKQDLYAAAQCIYILLNRGVIAPNNGNIPVPKDSPSHEFTELLRSILNPNISKIPSCSTIQKRLKGLMKQEHSQKRTVQSSHKNFISHKPNYQKRFF